jgi:hypothetical protein
MKNVKAWKERGFPCGAALKESVQFERLYIKKREKTR